MSSWNDKDTVIEDRTQEGEKQELTARQAAFLFLTFAGLVGGYFFLGQNAIAGLLMGLWLGAQAHGWKTTKVTRDATRKIKEYDRPLIFRLITLTLVGGADYFLLTLQPISFLKPLTTTYNLPVVMGLTTIAVVWTFLGKWRAFFKKVKGLFIKEPEPTEDDLLLLEFNEDTLPKAGLSSVGMDSGIEVKPTIIKKSLDENGRATVVVEPVVGQQTFKDYTYRKDKIADAWGVRDVMLKTEFDKASKKRLITITALVKESILEDVEHWEPLEEIPESIADYVKRLPMGRLVETGKMWFLNLAQRNFIIGGRPGSGKSSFANSLLAHLVRHRDVRVMFIDLKNGAESSQWEGYVSETIDNSSPDGISAVNSFLDLALDDLGQRYDEMKKTPAFNEKGDPITDPRTGKQKIGITNAYNCKGFLNSERPLKVLAIDESSDLFGGDASKEEAKEIREKLKKFVQQGRAAGYVLLMATQTPTEENIPRVIRNGASDKIAFGMDFAAIPPTLGGDYSPTKGPDPTELKIGEMVVRNTKWNEGVRIKTLYISDDDKPQIIAESVISGTAWLNPKLQKVWEKYKDYLQSEGGARAQSRAERLEAELEARINGIEEPDDSQKRNRKGRLVNPPVVIDDDFKWED